MRAQDLESLYVETNTFRLASHIYWALWALIQVRSARDSASTLFFFWIHLWFGPHVKDTERQLYDSLQCRQMYPQLISTILGTSS